VTSLQQVYESSQPVKNTSTFMFSNFNEQLIEPQPKPRFSERQAVPRWCFTTEGKVLCKERSSEEEYKVNTFCNKIQGFGANKFLTVFSNS
jgi:isoleucyl-tRNA synthetase